MSTKPTERKTHRLVARITKSNKRILERAAAMEGRSLATFVIAYAQRAVEELIHRQEVIQLNAEESRRFVEALLAPTAPPTRRMKRAAKLYRRTVVER
ncbi:MAG TPA: DUF1778 domain-containing protein [Verrucomicrobiae bacterium]|nr:DUF1778 domain-containing protein [Verrucomicrobiae bacterium]